MKSAKIKIQIGSASAGSVVTLEHCRFSYAYMALAGYDQAVFNDVQLSQCYWTLSGGSVQMLNSLASGCEMVADSDVVGYNATFDQCWAIGTGSAVFTNCIFSEVASILPSWAYGTPDGDHNGFYNSGEIFGNNYLPVNYSPFKTSNHPFKTAADAGYYLASGSSLHDAGVAPSAGAPAAIVQLQNLTTYAPEDGDQPDSNPPDLGYHHPRYDSDLDGLPDWWEYYWFGNLNHSDGELDANGYPLATDYQYYLNGWAADPNVIQFAIGVDNNYVNNNQPCLHLNITIGSPGYYAVLLDNTNFGTACWTAYTSSDITANLGSLQGWHELWVGLKGPAPEATVTWVWKRLKLDTMPPAIVITSPTNSTVNVPMIQIYGYCPEPLDTISCDVSNALGVVANLDAGITSQYYDTNIWDLTTNYFEVLDVPLTNGLNLVIFHATDLAGNVTSTNFSFTLDYAGKTAPVMSLTWPTNAMEICGNTVTLRGQVDDPTVSVIATVTDINGNSNVVTGEVERNGRFWVDHLPLNSGSNFVSITLSNAVNQSSTTNIQLLPSPLVLTLNDLADPSQLWQATVHLEGTVSDGSYAVCENGMPATVTPNAGDAGGTWSVDNVPVTPGGVAIFDLNAAPPAAMIPAPALRWTSRRGCSCSPAIRSIKTKPLMTTRVTSIIQMGLRVTGSGTGRPTTITMSLMIGTMGLAVLAQCISGTAPPAADITMCQSPLGPARLPSRSVGRVLTGRRSSTARPPAIWRLLAGYAPRRAKPVRR